MDYQHLLVGNSTIRAGLIQAGKRSLVCGLVFGTVGVMDGVFLSGPGSIVPFALYLLPLLLVGHTLYNRVGVLEAGLLGWSGATLALLGAELAAPTYSLTPLFVLTADLLTLVSRATLVGLAVGWAGVFAGLVGCGTRWGYHRVTGTPQPTLAETGAILGLVVLSGLLLGAGVDALLLSDCHSTACSHPSFPEVDFEERNGSGNTTAVTVRVVSLETAEYIRVSGGVYHQDTCDGDVVANGTACRLSAVGDQATATGLDAGDKLVVTRFLDGKSDVFQTYTVRGK